MFAELGPLCHLASYSLWVSPEITPSIISCTRILASGSASRETKIILYEGCLRIISAICNLALS